MALRNSVPAEVSPAGIRRPVVGSSALSRSLRRSTREKRTIEGTRQAKNESRTRFFLEEKRQITH